MVAVMPPMASTASLVAPWIWAIWVADLRVASAVWLASDLHLGGDDGKAAAGFAGARGLDGGVEREQVGLCGDAGDQLGDMLDLLGAVGERAHDGVGAACAFDGAAGDSRRIARPGG